MQMGAGWYTQTPMSKIILSRSDFFKLLGGGLGLGVFSYYLGLLDRPAQPATDGLPPYLDGGSAFPVFRGPYLQKNAEIAAFLYPARREALSALCDQTLNAVPGSLYRYVPVLPNLLLVCADMLVSSLDERDAQVGLIPEREVGLWMLTLAQQKTALGYAPHHLAWFLPSLYVDEGSAIATGREVYGFNKQLASITKSPDPQISEFSVDVMGFQSFGPDVVAQKQRLLRVSPESAQSSAVRWPDWPAARAALAAEFLPFAASLALGEDLLSFVARAALQDIPLVFIKQMRDAQDTRKACYQTLVEAPLRIQTYQAGGLFAQPQRLDIASLQSHPLIERLGLQATQLSALGAWLKVDFTLGV